MRALNRLIASGRLFEEIDSRPSLLDSRPPLTIGCACNGIVRCAVHRQPVPRVRPVPARLASEQDDEDEGDDDEPADDPDADRMEFPGHEGM